MKRLLRGFDARYPSSHLFDKSLDFQYKDFLYNSIEIQDIFVLSIQKTQRQSNALDTLFLEFLL